MSDKQGIANGEWINSLFGVGSTLGRIIIGCISDRESVKSLTVYNICLIVGGLGKHKFYLYIQYLNILFILH